MAEKLNSKHAKVNKYRAGIFSESDALNLLDEFVRARVGETKNGENL